MVQIDEFTDMEAGMALAAQGLEEKKWIIWDLDVYHTLKMTPEEIWLIREEGVKPLPGYDKRVRIGNRTNFMAKVIAMPGCERDYHKGLCVLAREDDMADLAATILFLLYGWEQIA